MIDRLKLHIEMREADLSTLRTEIDAGRQVCVCVCVCLCV